MGYSKADTVFNVQRGAADGGVGTGSTSAFPAALKIGCISVPGGAGAGAGRHSEAARTGAARLHAAGAGPSVLVFCEKGHEQVCDLVRQIAHHGRAAESLHAGIDRHGYTLVRICPWPTHSSAVRSLSGTVTQYVLEELAHLAGRRVRG
jgi:hypothetical protein